LAVTWIKPTYAHKRYNNRAAIKRKINYIIDAGKTTSIANSGIQKEGDDNDGISSASATMEYIQNPEKTGTSDLVSSYECSPETADTEFTLTKDEYERNTGRVQKSNSRLIYHITQSFKPNEVDPKIANKIGYELALKFTNGEHAFVVATHTNKQHIHNHIIINAFNLSANGKFKDPWYSGKTVVAEISDKICIEYGLSVIETKKGWGLSYDKWEEENGITKDDKEPTHRERLEGIIASCLEKQPKDLEQLLEYLEEQSCVSKKRGSNISIKTPFSKNPIRLNSLSERFTEHGICRQIEAQQNREIDEKNQPEHYATEPKKTQTIQESLQIQKTQKGKNIKNIANDYKSDPVTFRKELRLIIDIATSSKAQESIGYKKWAEKSNLEQMSQTLLFLERHNLSMMELESLANQKHQRQQNFKDEIRTIDEKLNHIRLMQRHIGTYGKTKEIYKQYKNSKNPKQFYNENAKAITDYESAKLYFDENGYGFGSKKKFPTIKELHEEYAKYDANKNKLWSEYHANKKSDKEIDTVLANVNALLNLKDTMNSETDLEISTKNVEGKKNKNRKVYKNSELGL